MDSEERPTPERILVTGGSGFIGSHLIDAIDTSRHSVLNLDLRHPSGAKQSVPWECCDIKDKTAVHAAFRKFKPTRVIHLAAKANLMGHTATDFRDNTLGTRNIVECVNYTDDVRLLVNTSSQYVVTPGLTPPNDGFMQPYTAYGESKAVAERSVRELCAKSWVTVRPTNIWGARHPFFPNELWPYLERRFYVHPGFRPIRKYYGYVSNVVAQILSFALTTRPVDVAGRTWYVTDPPIDSAEWMNAFSISLTGKPVRRIPRPVWRAMALTGDLCRSIGIRSPVSSDRLFRLTVDEDLPEEMMAPSVPGSHISLRDGVTTTVEWYHSAKQALGAASRR